MCVCVYIGAAKMIGLMKPEGVEAHFIIGTNFWKIFILGTSFEESWKYLLSVQISEKS